MNQNDLVPNILLFLRLNDICNCSKVNFVWLFHAFNVNSLNYFSFWNLITRRSRNRINLRLLQRLTHVRGVIYDFRSCDEITDDVLYHMRCFGYLKKNSHSNAIIYSTRIVIFSTNQ